MYCRQLNRLAVDQDSVEEEGFENEQRTSGFEQECVGGN
jgi:hypothetical protein